MSSLNMRTSESQFSCRIPVQFDEGLSNSSMSFEVFNDFVNGQFRMHRLNWALLLHIPRRRPLHDTTHVKSRYPSKHSL